MSSSYYEFVFSNLAKYSVAFWIFFETGCTSTLLGLNVSIAAVITDT